jgi:signal transduction histidine kinase
MLHGDTESYMLILDSLMANAVKFTRKGEIRIQLDMRGSCNEGFLLKTTVHDTGIGIPEDRHDLVFKEFGQVDGSYTRAYGGLGIGLNTAMLVVESVNGRLWFESIEGEGSDFHFTFPFSISIE